MDINEFQRALICVDAPGMYTTIQDAGRIGFQQYGMPVAGPMDSESYLIEITIYKIALLLVYIIK